MITLKHAYKFFKEKNSGSKLGKLDWDTYKKINVMYNKKVADKLISGGRVKLPHSMGTLQIRKTEVKAECAPIDWQETKKAKEKDPNAPVVYHMNFDSEGYRWLMSWAKVYTTANIGKMRFIPQRRNDGTSLTERMNKLFREFGAHKKFIKK